MLTAPVEDTYIPDKHVEAEEVFGADDPAHPAVTYLHKSMKEVYVGGSVQAINRPLHYDYVALRCPSPIASAPLTPQTRPPRRASSSRSSPGARSSPSRRATRCTALTAS